MNYKMIKDKRDKLAKEIEALKMVEGKYALKLVIDEKKKQYNFYNNLLKRI